MTGRITLFILSAAVFTAHSLLRAQEIIVPAGTILLCTLTEPNLSSKTVEVDDPILCDAGPIREFGTSVFPRGAYVGGRLAEYRDPGHLWGKGWLQLSFDRILLPGAEIPLSTKIVSVPRLRVDNQGRIHGRGHARRDAVEWMIPVLWPEKILTLPMRGPRPVLKGETRIALKLMQDLPVPEEAAGLAPYRPALKPGVFRTSPEGGALSLRRAVATLPEPAAQQPVSIAETAPAGNAVSGSRPDPALGNLTVLVLKDGRARLVSDYWFESGQRIRFVLMDGTAGMLPIGSLDLGTTVKLNRERGVDFVVRTKDADN